MDPLETVQLACEVADEGLGRGELPIGAVVLDGDRVLARRHTEERAQGRRIVHADLLALMDTDRVLGFGKPQNGLILAVNLEPCLMCLGAAIVLGVREVHYGLPSPDDGAAALVQGWAPPPDGFVQRPTMITGGHQVDRIRGQFLRYAESSAPDSMRSWARGLAERR